MNNLHLVRNKIEVEISLQNEHKQKQMFMVS